MNNPSLEDSYKLIWTKEEEKKLKNIEKKILKLTKMIEKLELQNITDDLCKKEKEDEKKVY